ncbi:MAG: malonyl CoA-acyl carrier protein transacylase [Cycloclasticus sp. symbiont of Poecilosclerida sp. M]|nr:MAG: malonyl CoA-acyl carrier protein transacylase [Cycloclasticus sp. symbiont of Poecilosclerida sp. M]
MSPINTSLAFVFPGQGSQSVGMLGDLSASYPEIKQTFEEASDALGWDLWALSQEGPVDTLNMTRNTQPAVLTASVALWRALQSQVSIAPASMAGHSLGEYSALVCANSLDFVDAVKLVEQRANFMQAAVPEGEGAMAAILGLEVDVLIKICDEASQSEVVSAVNFNAPGQVVIAGNTAAVNRAIDEAKNQGAKRALPLPVSVPSHCALMGPAADRLTGSLNELSFASPDVTVLHNTDVLAHTNSNQIKEALIKQLYTPVRWTETALKLFEGGASTLVECGPGKVLSGLNKRINRDLTLLSMGDEGAFNKTLEALS